LRHRLVIRMLRMLGSYMVFLGVAEGWLLFLRLFHICRNIHWFLKAKDNGENVLRHLIKYLVAHLRILDFFAQFLYFPCLQRAEIYCQG